MIDPRVFALEELVEPFRVPPGAPVRLGGDFDPTSTGGLDKESSAALREQGLALLGEVQRRLASQESNGVVVVLQGLDAAGKDGAIRHLTSAMNLRAVRVEGFKAPSTEELRHDFLWRYARRLPERGEIGIFHRSHYEEVLVPRVHPDALGRQRLPHEANGVDIWRRRYRQINDWERYLVENGFRVVKLFLNLSKEEQRVRFLRRCEVPARNWKFSANDALERGYWDAYQRAFAEMLAETSTAWAPWWAIPADHKWFARIVATAVLTQTLLEIDPHPRPLDAGERQALATARTRLEAEAPLAGLERLLGESAAP
jgi:PPK2 family polyphosphate:nucleotide phosphotransferase